MKFLAIVFCVLNNNRCSMAPYFFLSLMSLSLICPVFLFAVFLIIHFTCDKIRGHTAQWLRCCATNRKVAGSIPDGVIGIFH